MASKHLDRLTGQLHHLPSIIGRLGLSIAEAQKEMNADYVRSVGELLRMVENTVGRLSEEEAQSDKLAAFRALLESLAPSRYQFSETRLEFSADLAESMNVGGQVGASVGIPAVAVNASLALGYGREYQAAARISTVLHAERKGITAADLLARARELDSKGVTVPERTAVDDEIWTSASEIFNAMLPEGASAKAELEPPTPSDDRATPANPGTA